MRKIFFSVFTLLIGSVVFPQTVTPSVFNAGGGSYNDPNSSVRYFDWSIGELALINTDVSADGSLTVYQGVLQPGTEKPGITPISVNFAAADYRIFPNPNSGKFEIDFFVCDNGTLYLELRDIMGKLIEKRSTRYYGCSLIEKYDVSNLPAGLYFVVATLQPDPVSSINLVPQVRRSGLKVVIAR